jgi:formylglycine-generating enzyme required for sulfatase activity
MAYTVANYDPQELDRAMMRVPAGKVLFGLTPEEKAAQAQKAGVHSDMLHFHSNRRELEVPGFWIDRHPVTRGQFLRFMKETGYSILYNGWLVGWAELTGWHDFTPGGLALPMVGVNSVDAEAYAAWLGKRLPTEVEWERAWRGSDGRLFPWGNEWKDGFTFRNPGNTGLGVSIPVGAFPETGPHGLSGYGLVGEWVRVVFPPTSTSGSPDSNPAVLAGGAFCHTKDYSFLPTNRLSWSHHMRIYDSGFRCVADKPPAGLVEKPRYRVESFDLPKPLAIREDLYLKEKIRLVPTNWATFSIFVPWFPQSVWVLDCPEGDWDCFGGANSWPSRPKEDWFIPWKVEADGTRIRYLRESGGKKVAFVAWAEGHTVRYRFDIENIAPVRAGSFCLKTLSPFFSSQERVTQVRIEGGKMTRCCELPLAPEPSASFFWSLGEVASPARAGYISYDGKGKVLFPEGDFIVSGNGWPPCTHITPGGWACPERSRRGTGGRGSDLIEKASSGSFSFIIP